MTMTNSNLTQGKTWVPRGDNYEKRSVLSASIHPDIKFTLVGNVQTHWYDGQSGDG